MSVTPIPTSPAPEKSPPIMQASRFLGEFQVNGDKICGLTDGTAAEDLLAQINGIASLLQTALGALGEGDESPVIAPQVEQMHAAAGAIRNLTILASFADCAGTYQTEESLGAVMAKGGSAQ